VCTEWAETYQYAYQQLAFIADLQARVRAANGLMVTMDKVLQFNAPQSDGAVPDFTSADKIAQALKPSEPKAAPEKLSEEGLIGPAYDAVNKRWNYCPTCKTTDINHVSQEKGKEYQACFTCRIYLNQGNTTKPMPGRSR
jgi:hypothetical protein